MFGFGLNENGLGLAAQVLELKSQAFLSDT